VIPVARIVAVEITICWRACGFNFHFADGTQSGWLGSSSGTIKTINITNPIVGLKTISGAINNEVGFLEISVTCSTNADCPP
jgi:hypothetical protein